MTTPEVEPSEPRPKLKKPPNRKVTSPTILQMEAVECGAASLAMVLAHFGKIVPLEELRLECGVSRDGSKASNVMRAARKYGLVAKGFNYKEIEKLYEVKLPAIMHWNFNHFVVLDGYKGGKVFLNDPASGPRIVSLDDLDGSFSGVVLTFEPGPEFQKGGQKRSMMAALQRRLKGNETALGFVVWCGLLLVIPGLVVPTFSRFFVDEYLVGQKENLVKPLLAWMGLFMILNMILTWLREYFLLRLETKLALSTSSRFFNHILRLPVSDFAQRFAGEVGSRLMINNKVAGIVGGSCPPPSSDCFLIGFYAILMFMYDFTLTITCILLGMINVVVVRVGQARGGSTRAAPAPGRGQAHRDRDERSADDRDPQGLGLGGRVLRPLGRLPVQGAEVQAGAGRAGRAGRLVPPLMQLHHRHHPAAGQHEGDGRHLDRRHAGRLPEPDGELHQAPQHLRHLRLDPPGAGGGHEPARRRRSSTPRTRSTSAPRSSKRGRAEPAVGREVVKLSGKVELRDVAFGYSPLDKPLVEGFDLTIEPGQRVALVGGSGSGKSTVARVVSGLYQAWSGEILFDGIRREELPPELIRNSLAVVDQEVFLFGGTIMDNITMWDSTVPVTTVITACRDAAIDDVIQTRLGTYQSEVQEHGGNFSGGQRQRLEIARALVGSPTILILDEATSALDPPTELHIDDATRRRGCTCIIIAHRLSTIRDADEIVVLQRGKIVQRGTHEQMKDTFGPYRDLIKEH